MHIDDYVQDPFFSWECTRVFERSVTIRKVMKNVHTLSVIDFVGTNQPFQSSQICILYLFQINGQKYPNFYSRGGKLK